MGAAVVVVNGDLQEGGITIDRDVWRAVSRRFVASMGDKQGDTKGGSKVLNWQSVLVDRLPLSGDKTRCGW